MTNSDRNDTIELIHNIHKDARGFRPCIDFTNWTQEALDKFSMELVDEAACEIESEKLREREAWAQFKKNINETSERLGMSFSDTLRFDMQSHDCEGEPEKYCFDRGLGFFRKDELINLLEG